MPTELIQYAALSALLVPAVIGYTQAIKTQLPVLSGLSPFLAILVSVIVYYAYVLLPGGLFTVIYAAGGAMGVYTVADKIGFNTNK